MHGVKTCALSCDHLHYATSSLPHLQLSASRHGQLHLSLALSRICQDAHTSTATIHFLNFGVLRNRYLASPTWHGHFHQTCLGALSPIAKNTRGLPIFNRITRICHLFSSTALCGPSSAYTRGPRSCSAGLASTRQKSHASSSGGGPSCFSDNPHL